MVLSSPDTVISATVTLMAYHYPLINSKRSNGTSLIVTTSLLSVSGISIFSKSMCGLLSYNLLMFNTFTSSCVRKYATVATFMTNFSLILSSLSLY